MTPAEAQARLRQIHSDPYWYQRFLGRDVTAHDERNRLMKVISDAAAAPKPPNPDRELAATARDELRDAKADPKWRAKYLSGDPKAVAYFRELTEIAVADEPVTP